MPRRSPTTATVKASQLVAAQGNYAICSTSFTTSISFYYLTGFGMLQLLVGQLVHVLYPSTSSDPQSTTAFLQLPQPAHETISSL